MTPHLLSQPGRGSWVGLGLSAGVSQTQAQGRSSKAEARRSAAEQRQKPLLESRCPPRIPPTAAGLQGQAEVAQLVRMGPGPDFIFSRFLIVLTSWVERRLTSVRGNKVAAILECWFGLGHGVLHARGAGATWGSPASQPGLRLSTWHGWAESYAWERLAGLMPPGKALGGTKPWSGSQP